MVPRCKALIAGFLTASAACAAPPAPAPSPASDSNPLGLTPHHITASVFDLDRAIEWYRNMLGFGLRERGKHGTLAYAEMTIPGFGVSLVQLATRDRLAAAEPSTAPRWVHIVFSVRDPASVYERLKSQGASLQRRDPSSAGGLHEFVVEDSEGNEVEIVKAAAD